MLRNERGKMLIIIIAVVVVLALVGGVAAMKFTGFGMSAKKGGGPKTSLALGEFVVNLADTQQVRYLKADVILELQGTTVKAEGGEESGTKARIRDAVIGVLSSKRFDQLCKPGGKDDLKKEIIASVSKRLDGGKVSDVYFNEFAMQ